MSGALKAVPGVKTVTVNLPAGTATVVHDAQTSPVDLVKAVNGLSYLGQRGAFHAAVLDAGAPSGKPAMESEKMNPHPIDPDRQIVFVVQGMT